MADTPANPLPDEPPSGDDDFVILEGQPPSRGESVPGGLPINSIEPPLVRTDLDAIFQPHELVDSVFMNTRQSIIITTEDKLTICLKTHLEKVERSRDWIAPLTLIISLIALFVTTEFQDFILPKETWGAIFIMVFVLSLVWLLVSMRNAYKKVTLESLIYEIKLGKTELREKSVHKIKDD